MNAKFVMMHGNATYFSGEAEKIKVVLFWERSLQSSSGSYLYYTRIEILYAVGNIHKTF
jgi:hypothetical protein